MPVQADWVRFGDNAGYLARPARGSRRPARGGGHPGDLGGGRAHRGRDPAPGRRPATPPWPPTSTPWAAGGPGALVRERVAEVQAFMNSLPPTAWADPAAPGRRPGRPAGARTRRASRPRLGALFGHMGQLDRFVPALRAAVRHLRRHVPRLRRAAGGLRGLLHGRRAFRPAGLRGAGTGRRPPSSTAAPRPWTGCPRIACPVAGLLRGLDARVNAGLPAFAEAMARGRQAIRTPGLRGGGARLLQRHPAQPTTWAPPGTPSRGCWNSSGAPRPVTAA